MIDWRSIAPALRKTILVLFVVAVTAGCSNDSPGIQPAPSTTSTTESRPATTLPTATLIGDRCTGEKCTVADARPVVIGDITYVATRKTRYDKLGDPIAKAAGSDISNVEIREVIGVDPETGFAMTGDGLNAVRYTQTTRLARIGPAIVRLNPDDPDNGAFQRVSGVLTLEQNCLYLSNSPDPNTLVGSDKTGTRLVVWPAATTWHEAPRSEVVLSDGTVIEIGDEVQGIGVGGTTEQLTETHGTELIAGCGATDDGYIEFAVPWIFGGPRTP